MSLLNDNVLGGIPSVDIPRSKFRIPTYDHKTTFNQGDLIPIDWFEVVPSDQFSYNLKSLIRMTTPVFPVMDDLVCDVYAYYVPFRLLMAHYKEFFGENTSGPWVPDVEYTIPQLKFDTAFVDSDHGDVNPFGPLRGELMNRLGIPPQIIGDALTVSDMPNRAYRLIYNEFFRATPWQAPLYVPIDDTDRSYGYDMNGDGSDLYGLTVQKSCRLPDMFSMMLPSPQYGQPVGLPISIPSNGVPVVTTSTDTVTSAKPSLHYRKSATGAALTSSDYGVLTTPQIGEDVVQGTFLQGEGFINEGVAVYPSNLAADLSAITVGTVEQLRQAFAIQRLLERIGSGGSRYREQLYSIFGVNNGDARVQVPEFLGGTRFYVNMSQVVQTSETASSPQGNVAAYSLTLDASHLFEKGFTEPGLCMVLATVRVKRHTYGQGLDPVWFRKRRFDFYHPQLAYLGDEAVRQKNIYVTGLIDDPLRWSDDTVIGYQQRWYDYRQRRSMLSGDFSLDYVSGSSLASAWTYADYYDDVPTIGATWFKEPESNVQQTLAVSDAPQFYAHFAMEVTAVRPMPVNPVPGLIDHH